MRGWLLAFMLAVAVGHLIRPSPPPMIGRVIFATRVEGRAFLVTRLPDGECAVTFGGKLELPLDPAWLCGEL